MTARRDVEIIERKQHDLTEGPAAMQAEVRAKAEASVPSEPDQPSGSSSIRSGGRVVAKGRRKTAGWLVCGGGLAVLLSAFLPWVTVVGFVSSGIGASSIVIAGLGGGLAYLASRVLLERTSRATTVLLWILAGLDVVIVLSLFAGLSNMGGADGLVQPAVGFYTALLGFIATLVGTIMLQVTPRPKSSDGQTRSF